MFSSPNLETPEQSLGDRTSGFSEKAWSFSSSVLDPQNDGWGLRSQPKTADLVASSKSTSAVHFLHKEMLLCADSDEAPDATVGQEVFSTGLLSPQDPYSDLDW